MKEKYGKYEFCEDLQCPFLMKGEGSLIICLKDRNECSRNAKEFHHWLNDNGFEIIKKEK